MRITDLTTKWRYPRHVRNQIATKHLNVIAYSEKIYDGTSVTKRKILKALNTITYLICYKEAFPDNWSEDNPIDTLPDMDEAFLLDQIEDLYIKPNDIYWDLDIACEPSVENIEASAKDSDFVDAPPPEENSEPIDPNAGYEVFESANPEDLYLNGPKVPRYDPNSKYMSKVIDGVEYAIHKTLPEIPTRQCEISVTTDPRYMSDKDYLKLYPPIMFYTRPPEMYYKLEDIQYDMFLGTIMPIQGYTKKQLVDNIIRYPHLQNITRIGYIKGEKVLIDFGKYIEIDGVLHKTKDIWDTLPDTKKLPKSKTIMYEYSIRRYLLERDMKGIEHKYKMFGELEPFLTLFMPKDSYEAMGYKDTLKLAKLCVQSRISYLRSRNPVIRRIEEDE